MRTAPALRGWRPTKSPRTLPASCPGRCSPPGPWSQLSPRMWREPWAQRQAPAGPSWPLRLSCVFGRGADRQKGATLSTPGSSRTTQRQWPEAGLDPAVPDSGPQTALVPSSSLGGILPSPMKTAHQQASPALPPRRLPLAFQGVCQAAPEPACTLASPNLRAPRTSGPELSGLRPTPPLRSPTLPGRPGGLAVPGPILNAADSPLTPRA